MALKVVLSVMALASLLLLVQVEAGRPKKATEWRGVDLKKAEEALESGDMPDLVMDDHDLFSKEMDDRRKGIKKNKLDPNTQLKDPMEHMKHSQAMSGATMIFATLKPRDPNGKRWRLSKVSYQWQELLKTAMLDAKVFDITDKKEDPESNDTEPQRLLISAMMGWKGYEIRDFFLSQPEIAELEWDQVKYTPDDLDADGKFKGGTTVGKADDPLKQFRQNQGMFQAQAAAAAAGTQLPDNFAEIAAAQGLNLGGGLSKKKKKLSKKAKAKAKKAKLAAKKKKQMEEEAEDDEL